MIDVSIIVIGYNIEKYISRCMNSIINQTFKNIEIIYVDDGSTDNTISIVKKIKENDNRIKVVMQSNKGPYSARIAGINIASGKYVVFVDGDDWIDNKMIKDLHHIIETNKLNLVFFDYVKNDYIKNQTYNFPLDLTPNIVIGKEEISKIVYKNCMKNSNFSSPCNKIIRLDYLKKLIKYNEINLKYGEDLVMLLELYDKLDNSYYLNKEYYHYCINNDSSLSQIHYEEAFFKVHKKLFEIRLEYAKKWNVLEYLYNNTSYIAITELFFDVKNKGISICKKYLNDKTFRLIIKNSDIKKYIKDTKSKKTLLILIILKAILLFK